MEFGSLVREAWAITWRHRWLWVLGLFAGGSVGGYSGGGGGGPSGESGDLDDLRRAAPDLGRAAEELGRWVSANIGIIIAVVAVLGVLGLVATIISLIAQGGMARATADLATGQLSSLGQAWRAGLRLFWRYAGLWLLLTVIGLTIAALLIGLVVLVVLGGRPLGRDLPSAALAIGAVLLGGPLVLVALVLGIGGGIVVAYAQRAIAIRDLGPIEALLAGWRLLRSNLVNSLLVWLVNVALGIGFGIAIVIGLIFVGGALAVVGAVLWATVGPTAPTIAYAIVAGVVLFALLLVVGAAMNTFFWTYWTIAYLRLDRPRDQAAAPTGP